MFILNSGWCPRRAFFPTNHSDPGGWTHSVWLKVVSWYQELIQMHPIFSRCTQTRFSFPHKGSLCINLFCIYIWGCCRPWSVSPVRPGQPMCLTAGEPSDLGRVKDSTWANERMECSGGADGVTECLGTCHFVSVLVSTSGLLSLWPQAKYN